MNLPETYLDAMRELLGEETERYLDCFSRPRVYGLRVNTAKISVEDFLRITPFHLEPIPWVENGFYYDPGDSVTKHPHYYAGLYYIQEPSAMVPASRLPVEAGDRILDLCAAPGGKSTELAARLSGSGLLVSNDISHSRALGLLKNLELFGAGNILVTSEAPDTLSGYFPEFFDKILVDAPCSGEGMFRKDPDMVKSWLEHGPEYYAPIQREILRSAVGMLKPGGMLLYSTCTFSPMENEENLRWLLEQEPDVTLCHLSTDGLFREGFLPGTLRIWPQDVKGEGHFVALLQKNGDPPADEGGTRTVPDAMKEPQRILSGSFVDRPQKTFPTALMNETKKASSGAFSSGQRNTKASSSRHGQLAGERRTQIIPEGLSEFVESLNIPLFKRGSLDIRKDKAYLLPNELGDLKGLRFLRTGLYLGDIKKNRFEPSQALAMYLKKGEFKTELNLSSGDERVKRYLKGETLELIGEETRLKGWTLVLVDGYALGFGKTQNGTLKNKYCTGWRLQ